MQKGLIRKGLVLSVIVLFIGLVVIPSTGISIVKKTSNLQSDGVTLYVGGSGEGNYTKIQDAIDNSSDGDTVFVYNGVYVERPWLDVHKSINLIGEDKHKTIIDNQEYSEVVLLAKDGINISGFTLTNATKDLEWSFGAGILYNANHLTIYDNIITNNFYGISNRLVRKDNVTIINNTFENNIVGISTHSTTNVIINGNIIKSSIWVGLGLSSFSYVSMNSFENNFLAIDTFSCDNCSFIQNNFIGNIRNVKCYSYTHTWDGNYWGRPMIFPKIIIGRKFGFWILEPLGPGFPGLPFYFPYPMFDWNPALKPYDTTEISNIQGSGID